MIYGQFLEKFQINQTKLYCQTFVISNKWKKNEICPKRGQNTAKNDTFGSKS